VVACKIGHGVCGSGRGVGSAGLEGDDLGRKAMLGGYRAETGEVVSWMCGVEISGSKSQDREWWGAKVTGSGDTENRSEAKKTGLKFGEELHE
jgi:hypothetical protein